MIGEGIIIFISLCTLIKSRSIFHLFYSTILFPSFLVANAKEGGFIDYAALLVVYVLPPSPFFLFPAKIESFFYLHLHIPKMCTLYYLFRVKSAYDTHSKLVRSLVVRLEVKSLCGTSTDVSKLVRSYFNRKETRVFIHPRSKWQCRPIVWKLSFLKLISLPVMKTGQLCVRVVESLEMMNGFYTSKCHCGYRKRVKIGCWFINQCFSKHYVFIVA